MSSLIHSNAGQRVRTLDISCFLNGNCAARSEVAKELVDCLGSVGFVKLKNHGVRDREIRRVFDFVRRLFFNTSCTHRR